MQYIGCMSDKAAKEPKVKVIEPTEIVKVRHKSMADYKSKNVREPSKQSTRDLYMNFYTDYSVHGLTEKQVAEKHGVTHWYVCEGIKWAVSKLGNLDNSTKLQGLVEKLRRRQQGIELELEECENIKEKALIYGELRKTDRLVAELEGLLSTALIDLSDRRQVNMPAMNPDLSGRRKGVEQDEK